MTQEEQREIVIQNITGLLKKTPFSVELKVVKKPKGIKIIQEVTQEQLDVMMKKSTREAKIVPMAKAKKPNEIREEMRKQMAAKKNLILQAAACATERELKVIQECMRESRRWVLQKQRELKTKPIMRNFDGFYSRIKEQENKANNSYDRRTTTES